VTIMMRSGRKAALAATLGAFSVVAVAHADVTGSSEGEISGRKIVQPIAAAAVFTQTGKDLTGTIAVGGDLAGAYIVHGIATPKRVRVSGTVGANLLKWTGRITGDAIRGKLRLRGASGKIVGTLALTKNPPLADGASCDAVFDANQTTFTDQMLHGALLACTSCHVPGGQAADTRVRVTASDPLATARNVAALVDSANPDASRIVEKPLKLVPHGGDQQIVPGSPQETELRAWVALVAAAHCI
jgi:hypothetical protein